MKQITVNIDQDGNVQVEAGGVTGKGCEALTAGLEQELGATTGDVKKPEYHQPQSQAQKNWNQL